MSLTFLNPLILFGLAAGVIPVLIHRLTKRKAVTRNFSAVRLLLQSQRMMSRPQRLKHLLLLALRILAVAALVPVMARPVFIRPGILASGPGGAKTLIIDNSPSMGYREERGERYETAKNAARRIVEKLEGRVLLIPTAPIQGKQYSDKDLRWLEPGAASKELDGIPLSHARGNPATALRLAYEKNREVTTSAEILVVSDMAKGDWEGFNLGSTGPVPSSVRLAFLRIGGAQRDSNLSIRGVRLAEGEAVVGVPARLEVTVSNLSDRPQKSLIELHLGGVKRDQKSIELRAENEERIYFELFLDRPGWINGELRLSGDRLPMDDVFHFPLKVREKVKVLVVDGDPKTSLKASESYYLLHALQPGSPEGTPFLPKVVTESEMAGLDPRPYEAFFLLNVTRLDASRLSSILERGKPVFIFLGDRVIPEGYNHSPFLPSRLREIRHGERGPERIARIEETVEPLKLVARSAGESLKKASFHRYFRVDGNMRPLLSFANGDPLLSAADFGKGKLYLFTSSADIDWNDFPLKGAYLPLIQGLTKDAVGLNENPLPLGSRPEESLKKESRHVQLAGPEGGPGIYQYGSPSGEARYGLNPPPEESDLRKMNEEELKRRFGTLDVKMIDYSDSALKRIQGTRKELWPLLLAFVLGVLAVEMVVANGILRLRKNNQ